MKVAVFCASSSTVPQKYLHAAYQMGTLLADNGITVLTGGGYSGLMLKTEQGVLDHGGHVTAVIPTSLMQYLYSELTDIVETADTPQRKAYMLENSDVILVLPGGPGTLDEFSEALAAKQLGLCNQHIVILNTDGIFDGLLSYLEKCASEQFMPAEQLAFWTVAASPQEALQAILKYRECQ